MSTLWQDLRYGLRSLRRAPGFATLVVLTFALGIGAATVIWSVVDGVVLRPFPFPEPDRLVGVGSVYPRLGRELGFWENLSAPEIVDIAEQSRSLEGIVAWDMGHRRMTFGDTTDNLFSAFWWGDAFPTLGMEPALGRGFTAEEIEQGGPVAILSHRVWQTRFGADPDFVGNPVLVNGNPYTVIGVMPPRALIYGTDLWLPMGVGMEVLPRKRRQFQILARLAPEVTLEEANRELEVIAGRTEQEHGGALPEYEGWRLEAMSWTDINVRQVRPAAFILLGAVGFVLLLVAANAASLLLTRMSARRREIAVRTALGAGRPRLLRQLLTESLVLALLGGAAGVGLAVLGVHGVVTALDSVGVPIPGQVTVDARVLLFAVLVSLATGLLVGLIPAWQTSRPEVQETLSSEGHGSVGSRLRSRWQRVFVGVEVALALILLAGGALLVRSFVKLQAVDPGFAAEGVLTMRLTLPWERYQGDDVQRFFDELTRRVEALPGVESAATATQFPPLTFSRRELQIEGVEVGSESALPTAFATLVAPGYFDTLGIPLRRGRTFTERDTADAPRAAVIDEIGARRYFPDRDPVGARVQIGRPAEGEEPPPWFEIVGVVGATRNRGLDSEPQPEIFASSAQLPGAWNQLFLLVRTAGEPRALLPGIRETVRSLDPDQPVYAIQTVDEAYASGATPRRVATSLMSLFGVFALVLAAVGIYGVVAYTVGHRTREIGVRLALGAGRGEVRRLMVRQALAPVAIGVALGLVGALALGRALSGLLFEIGGGDPLALTGAAGLLLAMALLASYIPARRGSNLDPVSALRDEGQGAK